MQLNDLYLIEKPIFRYRDIIARFPKERTNTVDKKIAKWIEMGGIVRHGKGVFSFTDAYIEPYSIFSIFFPDSYLTAETVLIKNGLGDPSVYTSVQGLQERSMYLLRSPKRFLLNQGYASKYLFGIDAINMIRDLPFNSNPGAVNLYDINRDSKIYAYKLKDFLQEFPITLGNKRRSFFCYKPMWYVNSCISSSDGKKGLKRRYSKVNQIYYYEAMLEKALLDYIYLRKPISLKHIDVGSHKNFDIDRLRRLADYYPGWVKNFVYFELN